MEELLTRLKLKCKAADIMFEDEILQDRIYDAIDVVNERRGFTPTSSLKYEKKYEGLIVRMALYSLTKIGAEGEKSHAETGIMRNYENGSDYPDTLLNEIIPLAKA